MNVNLDRLPQFVSIWSH